MQGSCLYCHSTGIWHRRQEIAVLCGPGNNGATALSFARKTPSRGGEVTVLLLRIKGRYQAAAKQNLDIIAAFPITIKEVTSINPGLKKSRIACSSGCSGDAYSHRLYRIS